MTKGKGDYDYIFYCDVSEAFDANADEKCSKEQRGMSNE